MRREQGWNSNACGKGAGRISPTSASEPNLQHTLRHQVERLETQLRELAQSIRANEQVATSLVSIHRSEAASEEMVQSAIRNRSQRSKFFPSELFADPAWDMLLDLYLSEIAQRRVSVTSLCLASNVPSTTALRWIANLECEGLAERTSDPFDRRRYFMSLTGKGRHAMDAYFSSLSPKLHPRTTL